MCLLSTGSRVCFAGLCVAVVGIRYVVHSKCSWTREMRENVQNKVVRAGQLTYCNCSTTVQYSTQYPVTVTVPKHKAGLALMLRRRDRAG